MLRISQGSGPARQVRRSLAVVAGVAFATSVAVIEVRADLEKEDLEEKTRAELGGEHEHDRPEHENLLEKGQKNLEEINRLLKEIQDQLSKQQTGGATQAKQSEAVKKMEQLIKDLGKG